MANFYNLQNYFILFFIKNLFSINSIFISATANSYLIDILVIQLMLNLFFLLFTNFELYFILLIPFFFIVISIFNHFVNDFLSEHFAIII